MRTNASKFDKPYYTEHLRARRAEYRRRYKLKTLLWEAKNRAKAHGIEFTITVDDVIMPSVCPVSGLAFDLDDIDLTPSLDRVDNRLGYVPGNVRVIGNRVNKLKRDGSLEEFVAIAVYVATHLGNATVT